MGTYAREMSGLERELSCKLELEHTVLETRAQELRREARKQARQRAFLREERKRAREEKEAIEDDEAALKHRSKEDWFPTPYLPRQPERRLRLNVGGQIFEVSKKFLETDPDSLLAALSAEDCPLFTSGDGGGGGAPRIAYVDRDWWTFRYVLIFLRDGVLPANHSLVLQVYKEAAFWRLKSLQRAIEETHLNLTRTTIGVDNDPHSTTYGDLVEEHAENKTKFWLNRPNWWESQHKEASKKKSSKPDWWKDRDEYKGSRYPMSMDPEKVTASKDDIKKKTDVYPMLSSTWGYYDTGGCHGGCR